MRPYVIFIFCLLGRLTLLKLILLWCLLRMSQIYCDKRPSYLSRVVDQCSLSSSRLIKSLYLRFFPLLSLMMALVKYSLNAYYLIYTSKFVLAKPLVVETNVSSDSWWRLPQPFSHQKCTNRKVTQCNWYFSIFWIMSLIWDRLTIHWLGLLPAHMCTGGRDPL